MVRPAIASIPCVKVHTQIEQGRRWLLQQQQRSPHFSCILGFTDTGLIPGISAAGATPRDRQFTALADAEFLYHGPQPHYRYPLPPLQAGASPVLISRAIVTALQIPTILFNTGLFAPPSFPCIDLQSSPAACLSLGQAMKLSQVEHLFQQGLIWGDRLSQAGYLILGECVVGGTTTALAVLTALGYDAASMVSSSHPVCNHSQKWDVVRQGLACWQSPQSLPESPVELAGYFRQRSIAPFSILAAVGDPMQPVVAGMLLSASQRGGVLLAGGTQMLAVYALAAAIAAKQKLPWCPEQVVVGTTRWVVDDPTGQAIELAKRVRVPLLSTQLNFSTSRYPQLRAYEQGFVKEGVGAGGCAIAASVSKHWGQDGLLQAIEALAEDYEKEREKNEGQ